ncbi:hypothetical protein MKW92_025482 [Papaver armeniacum]|nr:hypothetical protein MKW92_025482 [Papaver armeniacum]
MNSYIKIEGKESTMERAEKEEANINNLERLPEGCISDILSLTTPADVCRSSLVSTLFKSAADSDVVWEKFLPANYQDIISREFCPFSSVDALSKKEIYYRLSDDPLLIDGGLKSFQLEKSSGKKCIMLGAKELEIAWGDTPQYWHWRGYYPGSRFAEVAEVYWVYWLEIRGKLEIRLLSPKTVYVAYLVLKLKYGASGFGKQPVKARVEVVGRAAGSNSMCSQERHIYLSPNSDQGQYFARERRDGWMEVEMGHFFNEELKDDEGGEVHMSVLENDKLFTKTGVIVQGIELRPKVDT